MMKYSWLLAVLEDIRDFGTENRILNFVHLIEAAKEVVLTEVEAERKCLEDKQAFVAERGLLITVDFENEARTSTLGQKWDLHPNQSLKRYH